MAIRRWHLGLALAAGGMLALSSAAMAQCGGAADFPGWLDSFRQEAAASGISPAALSTLDGIRYDQKVINADRAQGVFAQSFAEFAGRMADGYRLDQGKAQLRKHADIFARIEQEFGVPGPVLVGFWGLETDFGAVQGDFATLQSLATLAHDCRRPDMFRAELLAALTLLDRGDLAPADLKGAWAGEVGQMQFVPTYYLELAVDYDGDGKRNLVRSVPDVLASSANLLKHHGWQAGQPWLEEVRAPAEMNWAEADLAIKHPRSQWAAWGVTRADGRPLESDAMPASLVLPMGRFGPAFLAYDNFKVYTEWNNSLIYSLTAAYYATRLAGALPMNRGAAKIPTLNFEEIRELQRLLAKRGYDVGRIDGILGSKSRQAVRATQIKLRLPADSWPTAELLAHLRSGR